jgi:ubiquinone biosynthesis protein COQ4
MLPRCDAVSVHCVLNAQTRHLLGAVQLATVEYRCSKLPTAEGEIDAPHPFAWYGRRMRDVHDVWHVLTGYSTDGLGEACVVAFSYSQTKSLGFALIAHAGAYQYQKIGNGYPYRNAVMEAFRNGKAAAWLPEVDYVKLFGENLEAARERLNIKPATIYQSIPADQRDRPLTRKFDA